ncbi:hypothetical protein BGZ65_003661, partial [Modicella reniformis]
SKNWQQQPNQQHFQQRLGEAFVDPQLNDCRERTEAALSRLLEHGLIVSNNPDARDLGSFIKTHFLGDTSQYELEVSFSTIKNDTSEDTWTLNHLAQELQANIFLFSNRAKPRLYSCSEPKYTCALFHRVDSYFGIGEFLVLTFVNHRTTRMMQRQAVSSTLPSTSSQPAGRQQAAVLRKTKRVKKHSKINPSEEKAAALLRALEEACCKRIHDMVKKKVEETVKLKKHGRPANQRNAVEQAKQALWDDLFEYTRVPYGLMTNAMDIYRGWSTAVDSTPANRLRLEMTQAVAAVVRDVKADEGEGATGKKRKSEDDDDSHVLYFWMSVVGAQFEDIWKQEYEEKLCRGNQARTAAMRNTTTKLRKETHNPAPTLKQILHPDLVKDPETLCRILDLFEQQQEAATDVEDQMYGLAHKATLIIASGALWSEDPEPFDLAALFPEDFNLPEDLRSAPVAPLPKDLQRGIEEATMNSRKDELANLFGQNHLSAMFTHFSPDPHTPDPSSSSSSAPAKPMIETMGTATTSIWTRLSHKIATSSECMPVRGRKGMTHTINAHTRQCATMLHNLWHGSIYSKSLDYLLRFLLRIWLAPLREQSNKDRAAKHAQSKQDIEKERSAKRADRLTPSHWRHSMRKLLDQLADCENKLSQGGEGEGEGHSQEPTACRRAMLLSALVELDRKRPEQGIWDRQPFSTLGQPPLETELESEIELEPDDDDDRDGQADLEKLLNMEQEQSAQVMLDDQASLPRSGPALMDEDMTTPSHSTSPSRSSPNAPSQPPPSGDKPKEPNRKHLRSLQALLRILLESPSPVEQYTLQQVQEAAFEDHDFTAAELSVVKTLANLLRPFTPRRWRTDGEDSYRSHTPHVALRSPLVILANAVSRATGHVGFTRRIAPHVSTGDVHALHLGAMQLFETLCSAGENHFDVNDMYGNSLTNVGNVTSPKGNKDAVFFDIPKISQICQAHGTRFINRMMFKDKDTVHLVGRQLTNDDDNPKRHLVKSGYEQRRKNSPGGNIHDGKWRKEWQQLQQQGLTRSGLEERLSTARQQVQDLKQAIGAPRKETSNLRAKATIAIHAYKTNKDLGQRGRLFAGMKTAQTRRRDASDQLAVIQDRLTKANKTLYFWRKIEAAAKAEARAANKAKAKGKSTTTTTARTTPTWKRPAAEDSPQHLEISNLLSEHSTVVDGKQRLVGFWTDDPGVRVMSENGFQLKQDEDGTAMDIDAPEDDQDDSISAPPVRTPQKNPATRAKAKELRSTRITSKQIDDISFTRKLMKERERALSHSKNQEAKEALLSVSNKDVALSSATSLNQIDSATIRKFNKNRSLTKLKRTQRHRTGRVWAKVASNIRDHAIQNAINSAPTLDPPPKTDPTTGYCAGCHEYESEKIGSAKFHHPASCVKHKPEVRLIGCIGAAGTGVGSRIGGHSRRGGSKLRAEHRQHATVVITDEYMTSKTCPFCFRRTHPARARRLVGQKIKMVSINGAMECTNQHCESFQAGYTIKPRDGQASHNIGTTGGFALLSPKKEAMPAFSPHERQQLAGSSTRIQHLQDDAMGAP